MIELCLHLRIDVNLRLIVTVDGDRLQPEQLTVPAAVIEAIRADARSLEALVPGWSPRHVERFAALRRGVGLALGGVLFGRPELFGSLEAQPLGDLPPAAPTLADREVNLALRRLEGRRGTIRLLLSVEDPALAALPWELLRWPNHGEISLGTDLRFTLTRTLDASDPGLRATAGRPRVLATVSDPASFGLATPLGPTWAGIVGHIEANLSGPMDVDVVPAESLPAMPEGAGYALLIALGHGSERLRLMLPRQSERPGPPFIEVDAATFRDRFAHGGTPRLAVLIMCHSGGAPTSDGAGLSAAAAMIEGGCAAVVAMQGTVYLPAAEVFCGALVAAIGRGETLDRAVQQGRAALERYGQENAHREAPDHAFRPLLLVRQAADLEPLLRPRRWGRWAVGLALVVTLAIAFFATRTDAPRATASLMHDLSVPTEAVVCAERGTVLARWRAPTPETFAEYVSEPVQPFAIGTTAITQAQWAIVMRSKPSYWHPRRGGSPDAPVDSVSPAEALRFANAASVLAGLTPCYALDGCEGAVGTGCEVASEWKAACSWGYHCAQLRELPNCSGYRLPTGAEWAAAFAAEPIGFDYARWQKMEARLKGKGDGVAAGTPPGNRYGVFGLTSARREWIWPPRPPFMHGLYCGTHDGVTCTYAYNEALPLQYRSARFTFRLARSVDASACPPPR